MPAMMIRVVKFAPPSHHFAAAAEMSHASDADEGECCRRRPGRRAECISREPEDYLFWRGAFAS